MLIDEGRETSVLPFVGLDLDLELLGFFRELLREGLEFEELGDVSKRWTERPVGRQRTCCFQLSSSSTKKLLRLVTLDNSVSILPLRLIKSCHASIASREYWLRSRTISFRCLIETLVINGFFAVPLKTAFTPLLRPCEGG